ncbi:tRNA (5-methylaminomethyl-2-thiouridine)(34)-methyltransferase MnmD [Aliiroseovarius sp. PTFE2010]|uniref:tRNA (5-methylaminomethyl-2-thiouridine)(34)-methyltransferase MnmD n=1 Tax=Aliiroseovarius sp. PTFE2010 TaxID=3417190 RepID=UPI003CF0503C
MPTHQPSAALSWRDGGVPVSERFDDPYFSITDGLAETRHVFVQGNDLPNRFHDGFHVAELGFGTGLNLLTTVLAWQDAGAPGRLHFTSFEAYPMRAPDMDRALAAFPQAHAIAAPLLDMRARGDTQLHTDTLSLRLVLGDARATLPAWDGQADAWFLDGFSPAKNPQLWGQALMGDVARHTAPGGTFATYTAAGHVRRALDGAGFDVTRAPGFGRKRHMSIGRLR